MTFTVTDGELEDEATMTINVSEVNRAPIWDNIPENASTELLLHQQGNFDLTEIRARELKKQITELQALSYGHPLLMSMDAEPSLFNRRMPGTPEMPPTNTLTDEAAIRGAVDVIDSTLLDIGFRHNYAPVVDVSPNNEAIGNRTLGSEEEKIVPLAKAFIEATQEDQIIATAKHFPGHGRVSGDTHKKLVYIDGELTEVDL